MTCIKIGSDESHFNVLLIVRDKVTRQCPQITISEEKGEPKRNRTEVLLLPSLTPYRWAKPAHNGVTKWMGDLDLLGVAPATCLIEINYHDCFRVLFQYNVATCSVNSLRCSRHA